MLAKELQWRLEQLLERKIPDPVARTRAAMKITARIAALHPLAHVATKIAKGGRGGAVQLHGLGADPSQASSAVSYGAIGAKVGTVAIPIPVVGTVIGAVVGLVAGFLLAGKKYINVNNDNAEEDQDVLDIWPQYRRGVAGQLAGRDIGLPLLERVWKGAVYSRSDFVLNNKKVCFHSGCLKYPGDPGWIHGAIYGVSGGGGVPFTFPYALSQAGGATDPGAVADIFIANNRRDSPPWAVPATPAGRQILIDVADAYLAQKGAPYTYGVPQQSSALPQAISPAAPTVAGGAVSFPGGAPPQPLIATTPATSSDQLLAALLAQQGISATSPQGQQLLRDVSATGVQQAGILPAGVPQWLMIGGAVLAVGVALAHPAAGMGGDRSRAAA